MSLCMQLYSLHCIIMKLRTMYRMSLAMQLQSALYHYVASQLLQCIYSVTMQLQCHYVTTVYRVTMQLQCTVSLCSYLTTKVHTVSLYAATTVYTVSLCSYQLQCTHHTVSLAIQLSSYYSAQPQSHCVATTVQLNLVTMQLVSYSYYSAHSVTKINMHGVTSQLANYSVHSEFTALYLQCIQHQHVPCMCYSVQSLTMYYSVYVIDVARGGHGRAFALPSLNFALPSKPSFYLKFNVLYLLGFVVSAWLRLGNKFKV